MLGEKIRHYRNKLNITGKELAKRVEVSPSLISQIEQNSANPSIDTLRKIAFALEIPIVLLFDESDNSNEFVLHKQQRKKLQVPESNIVYELLTPDLTGKIEFLWIEIKPGLQKNPIEFSHEGEECLVIIEGQLLVWINEKEFVLDPGDSIYFDSNQPHRIANPGNVTTIFISANTPPSF